MRMSRVLLAGVAVATAGIATSAFTNSNTFNPDATADDQVGYGELAVSGVTVSNVAYNVLSTDATKLHEVVFTVTTDVEDTNSYLTITGDGIATTPFDCTPSAGGAAPYLVTCEAGDVVVEEITKVALTVVAK
ncbi:hypothetical protein JKP75_18585 [Blastococcus sp. TML/M2B]|uniref:hypothetical protein n=2 Tax=unclassified Blastococcus TaxID=2619396 RepID=UPI00190BDA72|nr:hypothetical protein [Blastococcus sp. TML/M2B]MBN1094372.1 hypothetical protein [Blastococcus sp. TML/M2B]